MQLRWSRQVSMAWARVVAFVARGYAIPLVDGESSSHRTALGTMKTARDVLKNWGLRQTSPRRFEEQYGPDVYHTARRCFFLLTVYNSIVVDLWADGFRDSGSLSREES